MTARRRLAVTRHRVASWTLTKEGRMEPVDVLRAALAAVNEADTPDHLQPVALGKMLDLFAGGAPVSAPEARQTGGASDGDGVVAVSGDRDKAIAKELEIDPLRVERLFDEHDGALQFIGDLEKLGSSKQSKVEKLSILLCAARQAAGYDADGRTTDEVIRAEVERHGLYDVTNYTKHVKQLRTLTNPNGTGKATTYKIKYEGRMAARAIAKTLLSD